MKSSKREKPTAPRLTICLDGTSHRTTSGASETGEAIEASPPAAPPPDRSESQQAEEARRALGRRRRETTRGLTKRHTQRLRAPALVPAAARTLRSESAHGTLAWSARLRLQPHVTSRSPRARRNGLRQFRAVKSSAPKPARRTTIPVRALRCVVPERWLSTESTALQR